jgi:hypothetical protein
VETQRLETEPVSIRPDAAVAASGIDIVYADTFIARGSNSLPQCSRMMR